MKSNHLIWIIRSFPNFTWPLKVYLIKKTLKESGKNFRCGPNSIFTDHRLIEIGDNVFLGNGTVINTSVPVRLGNNVMFGPEVMIMGGDHNFSMVGKVMREVKEGGKNEPVVIEDDVWIGARALILKGVIIGEGTVVGAGSVVTKSLPPYSICVGNPCKPVKYRFTDENLKIHLQIVQSKYSFEEIKASYSLWER
jgi:acetyltransferase-like isoleucine patch superfamily enzyme